MCLDLPFNKIPEERTKFFRLKKENYATVTYSIPNF